METFGGNFKQRQSFLLYTHNFFGVFSEGLVTPDLGVRDFEISKIQFRFQDFSQDFMISLMMFSFLLDFKDFN